MQKGKKRVWYILILLVVMGIAAVLYLRTMDLEDIERIIEKQHPVPSISDAEFYREIHTGDSTEWVIFDTREVEEYRQSHLPGALRVDPSMPPVAFLQQYGGRIAGKRVLFYCSVGYRSSAFAERLLQTDSLPSDTILNLQGGIFRWYNSGFPVYNQQGETHEIHPYNKFWSYLIKPRR